jgi:hypothetical protein
MLLLLMIDAIRMRVLHVFLAASVSLRAGKDDGAGGYTVTFITLFKDEKLGDTLESLAGTLKAAKKRGIISYKSELLLQGMSDNEVITLKKQ